MRILIAPELYTRREHLEYEEKIMDLAHQVEYWVENDPSVHVYWMLPRPVDMDHYDDTVVNADHPQVTVFNRRRFGDGTTYKRVHSWREEQLEDLVSAINKGEAWFDIVISLNAESQDLLWRLLHEAYDHDYCSVQPFDMIYYCWNLYTDHKRHGRYRNMSPVYMQMVACAVADEVWMKKESDMGDLQGLARNYLDYDSVKDISDHSRYSGMAVNFDHYSGEFAEEPSVFHFNGTFTTDSEELEKIVDLGLRLYSRYDISMEITNNQGEIDESIRSREFVTVHDWPSYEEYVNIIDNADISVSAPIKGAGDNRKQIEQFAGGQVHIPVQRSWTTEFLNNDYKFISSDLQEATKYAAWVVNNWTPAVRNAKQAQETLRQTCGHSVIAQANLDRMRSMLDSRVEDYDYSFKTLFQQTFNSLGDGPHTLDEIDQASKKFTDSGSKASNIFPYTLIDMITEIRKLGYRDTGKAEPEFVKA